MTQRLLSSAPVRAASFFFAAFALAAAPQAQVVFDDFDDGDVSNVTAFAGPESANAGAGAGPTDGFGGQPDTGLSVGIDPGTGGSFAGANVVGSAAVDASGSEYLAFYIRPSLAAGNLPLSLQVILQEDSDGDGAYESAEDDEYVAGYELSLDGNATWQLVEIPLGQFIDRNSVAPGPNDGFDFSRVANVVFALGDMPAGPAFNLSFDEIAFATATPVTSEALPQAFDAAPAVFPNPTARSATLTFELSAPSDVTVEVVDLLGRRVVEAAVGSRAAGEVRLDVPTAGLSAGVYVVRVRTADGAATTRMTVVR
jgi:hypothetical protein